MVGTNIIIQLMWVERRTIINTPSLVDAELDERLVQSRNAAFRTAFKVFALLVLIAWPISIFAATQVLPNDEGHLNSLLIFLGIALLATTLPTAIVAWREPDPTEPEPPSG